MSVQKAPDSNKRWIQSNNGEYYGNIVDSFNMDFDTSPGVAKASKKLTPIDFDGGIDSEIVQALATYGSNYYAVTRDDVFNCSVNNDPTDTTNWSAVTTLGTEDLGTETDATVFKNLLLISLGTDIMSWDGSTKNDDWWTTVTIGGDTGSALTASKPHTLEVLRTGNDTLFVTDGSNVRYANDSAGHTVISLEDEFTTITLLPGLDRMWVGTFTETSDHAFVYEIRVGDDIAFQSYPVDGLAALSGFVYKNTPFIITERGFIQMFNGAGFETVAQFPFALVGGYPDGTRPGLVQDPSTARAIHPKGCKVRGKYAYIYANLADEYDSSQQLDTKSHSGVWVLDLETYSLTHRYALSAEASVTSSGPILLPQTTQTFIMVGGETSNNATGLWVESANAAGHFTLARHEAESVADSFESFTVKHDTLVSGESIQVAERHTVREPLIVEDAVWLNGTSFTTANALTSISVGDEVFVYDGDGAGEHGYITTIDGSTTKTVTLDADLGTSLNDTSSVYITNFNRFGENASSTTGEVCKNGGVDGAHPFVQYRVWLAGNVTVRETLSKSDPKKGV